MHGQNDCDKTKKRVLFWNLLVKTLNVLQLYTRFVVSCFFCNLKKIENPLAQHFFKNV